MSKDNKQLNVTSNKTKYTELVLLFVLTPIILAIPMNLYLKGSYFLLGIVYISWISFTKERFVKNTIENQKEALTKIALRFVIVAIGTTIFIYFFNRDLLFEVMLNKTSLWLKFNLIYVLVSVIPQELIYRSFFVKRYKNLFKNDTTFIVLNSLLFSFAHIWFKSWIVLTFTLIGGFFFIRTYLKTKSLWLVLLEHSIYGIWLYTVGFGKLFLFPT